ncbi:MAG: hypothetical protein ACOYD0_12085 [Candidatus Nanopelagicales bacterium]
MLLATGAVIRLVFAAGCSNASTGDAAAGPGTIESSAAGNGAAEGTPKAAPVGTKWSLQLDRSGIVVVPAGQATSDSIQVQNNLPAATTTVDLLRGGKVLASSGIPPTAAVQFKPNNSYYIALAPKGMKEGDVMKKAVMNGLNCVVASVEPGQNVTVEIRDGSGSAGPYLTITEPPN